MSWTAPKTWEDNELVTADLLNTHLRDNLDALKSPPTAHFEANEASDYTTTSTSFVNVDGTAGKFNLTITTTGGDVLVGFTGVVSHSVPNVIYFDVLIDSTIRAGGDDGVARARPQATGTPGAENISFTWLIPGLSVGEHTFKLQWRTAGGGTATLYAGAGTSSADVHPQFWVREAS